ncbi:MAG: tetratricopeptide repeat protein [Candidatus Zixiibacteriota bacterium]|nr:MAG: tetratricopeptide repeat protein [candidate division Zixibacteria bacterium]
MSKNTDRLPWHLTLIVLALLFAVAVIGPVDQLWGLNFLKFYSSTPLFFILPLLVILSLPPVSSWISRTLASLSYHDEGRTGRLIIAGLVISLLVTAAGLLFPSATYLLGDAHLRLNQIADGKLFLPTELIDFLLHAVAYNEIFQPLGYNSYDAYHVISALCGFLFTLGVFRLARYMAPKQLWITFLLTLSSGVLVLFFGYVESYSLLAAMLPHIYLLGLKVIDGQSKIRCYIVLCTLAVLVHVVAAVILVPSVLLLFLVRRHDPARRGKKMTITLMSAIAVVIVVAYILRYFEFGSVSLYLMPWFARADFQHGIFTANHFLNIFNWLYLAALPALFLAPYVLIRERMASFYANRKTLYALWVVIPSLAFVFFFTPQLGGPRDWDLFSLVMFLWTPSMLTLYLSQAGRRLPVQTVPLAVLSLTVTLSFAAVNSNVTTSAERFSEILEVSKFKNLTKEYRLLAITARVQPEIQFREVEFLQRAWQQPPYTFSDSVGVLTDLGLAYLGKGDRQRSYQYIMQGLQLDTLSLGNHQNLVLYLRKYGTRRDVLETARLIERRFRGFAPGMMTAGMTYWEAGDAESGGRCLQRAYELDSEDYYIILGYGRYLLDVGESRSCIEVVSRAIEKNPQSFQAHYITASAYHQLGETERSLEFLTRARNLQRSQSESRLVQALEERLRK